MSDILCPGCQQPMLPEGATKQPNEYDHAQGCPLDPQNPANYPSNSGNELQEIINHASYKAEKYQHFSSMRSVTYLELADVHVLIMRLAAYVQGLEGQI